MPVQESNGWNEWKRHVLACLETLAEQGNRREANWQTDHDLLTRLDTRLGDIDDRLRDVESLRRESRWIEGVLAILTAILGYLGIKYGGNP